MSNNFICYLLLAVLLVSGCQQQQQPGQTATPGPTSAAESPTPAPAESGGLEVKIADGKDMTFQPSGSWFDPRSDVKKGTIALGNYDFVVTPRAINSLPDVKEGQRRVMFGLKSPEGAEFETPIPVGEYTGDAIQFTDVVYFENGSSQRHNFANPKGTVTVTELTDTEIAGSVDITGDKGGVLKGDFRANITGQAPAGEGASERKLLFDIAVGQPQAKGGDTVLTPMPSKVTEMTSMGTTRPGSFRPRKMVKPGAESSRIEDNGKEVEIPNALIIALSADAKVKNGDIVLAYPQYGEMTRAIVTEAGDGTKPTVHFFKKVFGSKQPEGDEFTGQLESGTFRPLNEGVEPGNMVLYPDGNEQGFGQVINATEDKVLVSRFGGELAIFEKSEVTALPLKPSLKEGDKVQAPFAKGMDPATVTKVNDTTGRVWVKFDKSGTESVFAYGEIMPG